MKLITYLVTAGPRRLYHQISGTRRSRVRKKLMKDWTFKTAVFIAAVILLIPASSALVNAQSPTTICGEWKPDSILFYNDKYVGANVIMDCDVAGHFTGGSIAGTFTQTQHMIFHYGDPEQVAACQDLGIAQISKWPKPTAFEFTQFIRTATGTLMEQSGTFEMLIVCSGHGMPVMQGPGYDLVGTWRIVHGSGDLANLHGQGTWWHTQTGYAFFDYEGQVHFDP